MSRGDVKSHHDCSPYALYFAAFGVDDALFHDETFFAHFGNGCHHTDFFIYIGGRMEVAVYVCDHNVDVLPVDAIGHYVEEVTALAKIEKSYIHSVVQVTEHIDVVEPHL